MPRMKSPRNWPLTIRKCRSAAQRHRRGLGSAIDYAQRRLRSDAIIVHDGVTPIDASEMRSLWRRWIAETPSANNGSSETVSMQGPMSDLANLPAIHAAMERAHGRLLGFQMVRATPVR